MSVFNGLFVTFFVTALAYPALGQDTQIQEPVIEEQPQVDPFLRENSIEVMTLENLADPDFDPNQITQDELSPEERDLMLGNQPPPGGYSETVVETQGQDAAAADGDEVEPPDDFQSPDQQLVDGTGAILRGLDTLNGTVRDFTIDVSQTLEFERLHVTLYACRYPEDDATGEAYAFLAIRDKREEEPRFSGWMLASSPALSALDHPRYDIWVLSCKTD